ncbi:hypothetical protein GCM10009860_09610 [Microbacterium mitrae]|uniref:Polysaccharide pyruvyl transferase family protein n=1 Tax=Microbacterium mitrae TaxID=664640 RepID=A0A5C8HTA6_9MICO|nr:polysaccharide pyruvyl transferase family protein [Microbacterium mitrae]TXK06303.1 polysaccharide pyruvyl transferase family protein [Microbacterium mitrae]
MIRRTAKPTRTFVSLTGPAGNIGDALIRRGTLEWAKGTSDELIAYVGEAPDVWLKQLGVPDGTRVLRGKKSVAKWLWLLATSRRRPVLVLEAGEVPLHKGNGLRELVFLAETLIVRLKRGVVVRPPRGIRGATQPSLWFHSLAAKATQVALWRDAVSARLVGSTTVVPDIGFADVRDGRPWAERHELLVSLRGARPLPNAEWVAAVKTFAAEQRLTIRTVVQVREDEERSRELADALGATFEPWEADAVTQEATLCDRYDAAKLVISDRMHVLVLAALGGAVPVELVPNPTAKITQAFAAVGLHGITGDATKADMLAFLAAQIGRADEVRERMVAAAARLADIESSVRDTIRQARA